MYYIKSQPTDTGNHGNPVSTFSEGMVTLPDELLEDYIAAMGFVVLTVEDGIVTALAINQEAYDDYMADQQEAAWRADRGYEPGEYITYDGTMYKVILPIFAGSLITIGTNVAVTTLEAVLANLTEEA